MAAAVVLQEAGRRAGKAVGEGRAPRRSPRGVDETGEHDVEVAVVVRVHQGGGDVGPRIGRNARGRRHVGESAAVVVKERDAAAAEEEQVRMLVVVVVPRYRARRALLRIEAPCDRDIDEATLFVVVEPLALGARRVDVERAITVQVDERNGARQRRPRIGRRSESASEGRRDGFPALPGARRKHARGRVGEAYRRRRGVDEVGLRPGGRHGLRVAPLLRVVLADQRPVTALAQHSEALEHLLAFLRLAGADEGEAEVVDGGGVVGLGRHRGPELCDGLRILARLEVELAEVDERTDVVGIERQHLPERRFRLVDTVLPPRDQAEDVVRRGQVRQGLRGGPRLALGARKVGHVEERDGEVGAGNGERRIDLQRFPEGLGRIRGPELLEQRHPPVVRAVGVFPHAKRRRRGPNE